MYLPFNVDKPDPHSPFFNEFIHKSISVTPFVKGRGNLETIHESENVILTQCEEKSTDLLNILVILTPTNLMK